MRMRPIALVVGLALTLATAGCCAPSSLPSSDGPRTPVEVPAYPTAIPAASFNGTGDETLPYHTTIGSAWVEWEASSATPDHPFTVRYSTTDIAPAWNDLIEATAPGSGAEMIQPGPGRVTIGTWLFKVEAAGPWRLTIYGA